MAQTDEILAALRRGEKLTPGDAFTRYGCFRLAARIYDLKQAGHDISERLVTVHGRHGATCQVAEYSMAAPGLLLDTRPAFVWDA